MRTLTTEEYRREHERIRELDARERGYTRGYDQVAFAICGGVATTPLVLAVVCAFERWSLDLFFALLVLGAFLWVILILARD